jgi:hypothetical protein
MLPWRAFRPLICPRSDTATHRTGFGGRGAPFGTRGGWAYPEIRAISCVENDQAASVEREELLSGIRTRPTSNSRQVIGPCSPCRAISPCRLSEWPQRGRASLTGQISGLRAPSGWCGLTIADGEPRGRRRVELSSRSSARSHRASHRKARPGDEGRHALILSAPRSDRTFGCSGTSSLMTDIPSRNSPVSHSKDSRSEAA